MILAQFLTDANTGKDRCFAIPDSEWAYLHQKVGKLEQPKILYQALGSASFGVAASALVAALTISKDLVISDSPSKVLCWVLTLCFTVIGVLSTYFGTQQKHLLLRSKDDVLAEMERIEKRYRQESTEKTSYSQGQSGSI